MTVEQRIQEIENINADLVTAVTTLLDQVNTLLSEEGPPGAVSGPSGIDFIDPTRLGYGVNDTEGYHTINIGLEDSNKTLLVIMDLFVDLPPLDQVPEGFAVEFSALSHNIQHVFPAPGESTELGDILKIPKIRFRVGAEADMFINDTGLITIPNVDIYYQGSVVVTKFAFPADMQGDMDGISAAWVVMGTPPSGTIEFVES